MARPSRPMLTIMAPTVSRAGMGRVKPSVYLRPMAQQTSNRPARNRMIQDMGRLLSLMGGPSRMVTRMERRGRPRVVRYSAHWTAQGKARETGMPWQWLPELSGRSDTLGDLFAAQGLEQRRQEVAQGQHREDEAGVELAQGIV